HRVRGAPAGQPGTDRSSGSYYWRALSGPVGANHHSHQHRAGRALSCEGSMATSRPVPVMADTIRRAKLEDAPSVYAAWQRMRAHNHEVERRVVPAPVTQSEFAVDLAKLLSRPRSAAFVAMRGKDLAGFIAGSIEESQPDRMPERHATVGYLCAEPQFPRAGLGMR